jgi:hypothetical protein
VSVLDVAMLILCTIIIHHLHDKTVDVQCKYTVYIHFHMVHCKLELD